MYLDSCIIVKLLVPEADSATFQAAAVGARLSTSELALTEVFSTLLRKEQNGELSQRQRKAAWAALNALVARRQLRIRPLDNVHLLKANHILEWCHPAVPLRTLDAIHTAACDLSQDFPLCTTDRRMRDAAKVLGIPVFPEEKIPDATE
jgi:predicted nucleic acid-binding protein